ncbi:MAG: hypothetical protein IT220_06025 [Flavobacteriaceae bacterium]|nr:hypothetical protein [Flavobacteriaceae bacterium]
MTHINFRKEKISIQHIGKQRFWIGLFAGLISAILMAIAFNNFREALRYYSGFSSDLLILENSELRFFNYFFSVLASVMGLSVSIWIWMNNFYQKRRKDWIFKQLSKLHVQLIFFVILMMITRFGTILHWALLSIPGYDQELNLYKEYWVLFILLPLVVFLQSWFSVRLIFRAGKWILLSFVYCILISIILVQTTTIDQKKINTLYFQRFEKDYQYIDYEIEKAKTNYGITFSKESIEILKKWNTTRSVLQVVALKNAFTKEEKVSLDTIILQKIVIRNFKNGNSIYYGRNSIDNWPYALPNDILKQLYKFEPSSNRSQELLEVLKEEIDLVNTTKIDYKDYKKFSETEHRRSTEASYSTPVVLINQLKGVRDILIEDERYGQYAKQLPEIRKKVE